MTRSRIVAFGALCAFAGPLTLVACGGDSGGNGGTDPVVVDAVSVSPASPSVVEGQTVQLTATPEDEDGGPLSRAVSWTSLNTGVATVNGSGLVTGVAAGSADIRATSEGVHGTVTVTVTPRPVATVSVTPDSTDVAVGDDVQLTATTLAANGDTLTGRAVTWASSNNTIASVSSTGLVSANGAGVATITATSGVINGSAKVVVFVPSSVVIDSITPSIVVEGGTATIFGSGFAATVGGNTVTLDGVAGTVTAATETTIAVTLPAPTGCQPARNAQFRVSAAGGQSPNFAHAVRPATFLDMEVGELTILTGSNLCIQFAQQAGAERYVVGVQSTTDNGATVTNARLTAVAGAAPAAAPQMVVQPGVAASRAAGAALPRSARDLRLVEHRAAELDFRDRERALASQLASLRAARQSQSISASRMTVPPDAAVGDTIELRMTNPSTTTNLCTDFFTITAVVRVIGTSGIWLTDVSNPAGGYSDADLQALSDMFDDQIYATDVAYLGAPSDLDNNDRVAILTTRRVNATAGLLGFVFSGDLFPVGSCAASNEGEIYYGIAPDPNGDFGSSYALADARIEAPALIAHEFAHILQNSNGGHTRAVWESEGQATFIEEVVGFAAQGRSAGNDYGAAIMLNDPATDSISWYVGHLIGLATYVGWNGDQTGQIEGAPEQCSWLVRPPNGPCINDARLVYDVPKSLLRYISDQFGPSHPQGEKGVQLALLQSSASGYAAVEDVTGLPIGTVLARWAASLYLDDRFPNLDPVLETSTWDMFDVWTGIRTNARLTPRARSYASFSDDFSVRGGSTAYFEVSGASRPPVAMNVTTQTGASLPGFMQVWIVRAE
ncbi:MAG TPA: Ig-like domain-containing protein [Longimicrobiales bacterium]